MKEFISLILKCKFLDIDRECLDEENINWARITGGCEVPDHQAQQGAGGVPHHQPRDLPDQEGAVRAVVWGADKAGDDGLQGEGDAAPEGEDRAEADTDGISG